MKRKRSRNSPRYSPSWWLWISFIAILAVSAVADTQPFARQYWSSSITKDAGLAADSDEAPTKKDVAFWLLHNIERVSSASSHRHRDQVNGLRGGSMTNANTTEEDETREEVVNSATNTSDISLIPTMSTSEWVDSQARSLTLALAWVVSAQVVSAVLHSFREQVFALASRFVKQDTLAAARSIRQMLETMDDHGMVDLLAHHEPAQILVSIYALSKLQAACQFHERSTMTPGHVDLELLQDLYDCIPFATAAYGWKFNLATSGQFHKGDRQALVQMTQVDPSDIVTVNFEARPNRPAFYIVRDRKRKRIVLAIRGTWSAHDVLTDLCCTPEEYFAGRKRLRAHNGMLTAARGVSLLAEDVVAQELEDHPDYSLMLVGHSLGGSAAAVLGTLWAERFRHVDVNVYTYGPACVFPESFHDEYKGANIVSVLLDGDPFSCLSLGHVADVSGALDYLCEDRDLRRLVIARTEDRLHQLSTSDLVWCSRTMSDIKRSIVVTDKLYAPGKLLFIHRKSKHSKHADCSVQEVTPSFFHFWKLGPHMFDLTRHAPKVYETSLRKSIVRAKQH